ncbi:hypothetical protein QBC35DRAFT_281334 [Podospora australis]|uniref:Transmembrane protein n=1 Tax=Podospora australis TaxID=1536484 RepID=A0AAN6WRP3_9PEZI|nr:hypothetical protein QBC35DRAFT_281334 [Podospora australis]
MHTCIMILNTQQSCGTPMFDDFRELVPGSVEQLAAKFEQENSLDQQSSRTVKQLWATTMRLFKASIVRLVSRRLHPTNPSDGDGITSLQVTGETQGIAPEGDAHHLLPCIDKGSFETTLHHCRVEYYTTDRELFSFLRREYYDYRKPKTWFTLRSVGLISLSGFTVDLSTFAEVHKHSLVCNAECVCLPPEERVGSEYVCSPAPGTQPTSFPAISARRMTHYFRSPTCAEKSQSSIYQQLPKRVAGELKASRENDVVGWGVHCEEGWHWRTIYLIIAIFLFCFSLLFGIIWATTKSDIQGGFAVSSFWLTTGSVLLGYVAVKSQ